MRRKRILKCALTLVLLLGIFCSGSLTAMAAGEVSVQVNSVDVSPEQTVTTELIMNGTFAAFQGRLVYDTEALTLEKIEATSMISGSMTLFNQDEITSEFIDASFVGASANNMTVNGAVLTFTFRASSNASGTYSFNIEQFQVYDEGREELTVEGVDTIVEKETLEANQDGLKKEPPTQESTPTQSPNDSDSDNSSGNGLVIVLIILAVVVVGAVVAVVIRAKKKNSSKK